MFNGLSQNPLPRFGGERRVKGFFGYGIGSKCAAQTHDSSVRLRLDFSAGTLVLSGNGHRQLPAALSAQAWAWDPRVHAWRCDACHYLQARQELETSRIEFEDRVQAWERLVFPRVQIHPLRNDQQAAVLAWTALWRGTIVMPTGTGKTEVALACLAYSARSTLIIVPLRTLMHQWRRRIGEALGFDAGLVGDGQLDVKPVTVTTYHSAAIHMPRIGNRFGLVVFDECHHLPGDRWRDAALFCAAPRRLGLTATPDRADRRHTQFDRLVGPIVYKMAVAEAAGKSLAPYDVVRVCVQLSSEEKRHYDALAAVVRNYCAAQSRAGKNIDWAAVCREARSSVLAQRVLKAYRAKKSIEERAEEKLRVIEDLLRLHAGEPCLIFTGSNAMARDVSRHFLIPCLLNNSPTDERQEVIDGLQQGRYPAIVANRVLDEGIDLPQVHVAMMIGGTSSARQATQRLGRILRRTGNARAVLYEVICDSKQERCRSRRRTGGDAFRGKIRRKR